MTSKTDRTGGFESETQSQAYPKVVLAGCCTSSALKIWIDSEDRFGTQSPKFQVQSTGGRVFQVDDRFSSYKVWVTIYVLSPFISRRPQ